MGDLFKIYIMCDSDQRNQYANTGCTSHYSHGVNLLIDMWLCAPVAKAHNSYLEPTLLAHMEFTLWKFIMRS